MTSAHCLPWAPQQSRPITAGYGPCTFSSCTSKPFSSLLHCNPHGQGLGDPGHVTGPVQCVHTQSHLDTQTTWPAANGQPTSYASIRILKGPCTNPQGTSAGSRSPMMVTSASAWPFSGAASCVALVVNACTCHCCKRLLHGNCPCACTCHSQPHRHQRGADGNMGPTGSQSCTSTTTAQCCISKVLEQVQATVMPRKHSTAGAG